MEAEDLATNAITNEVPPGVLSDDQLSHVASGAFSEGKAEVGGGEVGEQQNQVLGAGDFPTKGDGSTLGLIDLCRQVAERLEVPWPTPTSCLQQTWLAGHYFLPQQPATVRHKLPVFPDFVQELSRSWVFPKAPLPLPFFQIPEFGGDGGSRIGQHPCDGRDAG